MAFYALRKSRALKAWKYDWIHFIVFSCALCCYQSPAKHSTESLKWHFILYIYYSFQAMAARKFINIAMAKWKRNCFDLKAFPRELEILKWTSLSELERWRSSSIRAEWMHLWSSNRAIARMKNNLVISLFIYYWNVSTYRSRRPIYRSIEQHTSWMRINLWFPNRFNIILAEEILFFCFNYNYESHLIHEND